MGIVICDRCNQRVLFNPESSDISHTCNSGNPTLDNEDVVVIGAWIDFDGSGRRNAPFMQGSENTLFGTRAAIEGEDNEERTRRGLRASTRRQRRHIQFIDLARRRC